MNFICTICLLPCFLYAQHSDSLLQVKGLQLLTGGSVDILQTGQVSASARLFKLYFGEPGKFRLPVSIYTGITVNHFSKKKQLEDAVHALTDPGIGMIALSVDGRSNIAWKKEQYTKLFWNYRAAVRLVNIGVSSSDDHLSAINFISGTGIFFTTGAWEQRNEDNIGLFWLTMQFFYSDMPRSVMSGLFLLPLEGHVFSGMTGMGVELKGALQIKLRYYRALSNQTIKQFREGQLQLSVRYEM